jgi:hypothetical protein
MSRGENLGSMTYLDRYWSKLVNDFSLRPPRAVRSPLRLKKTKVVFGPWRRGIVVIAFAYKIEDPGFESRQDGGFFGMYTLQCCCHN